MKILSVECSAGPASCAIIEDGKIRANSFVNAKLTHSQTLLHMIINTLENSVTELSSIDKIAVAVGPGSFTGLRIGISAIKGLAAPLNIPCVPVSTLDGLAENFTGFDGYICTVMDARCNQFYNALFEVRNGQITRIYDDRALLCDELKTEIAGLSPDKEIIICGDGADLFYKNASDLPNVRLAPENLKFQSACGVGLFAYKNEDAAVVSADKLLPVYLRLPQAERELKAKTEAKK